MAESLVSKEVEVHLNNRKEEVLYGTLLSMDEAGLMLTVQARGNTYTTFVPHANCVKCEYKHPRSSE